MNPDVKSIFASKTLWSAVIAALPTVLGLFGFKITDLAGFTAGSEQIIDGIVTLVGTAGVVYGRIKANKALVIKS